MEETNILLAVMLVFAGGLLLLLGYITRQNQDPTSITLPHLDLSKIKNKKGFAQMVGSQLMLIGLACLGTAGLVLLLPRLILFALLLLIGLVICLSFRLVIRHKQFIQS